MVAAEEIDGEEESVSEDSSSGHDDIDHWDVAEESPVGTVVKCGLTFDVDQSG